MLEAGPSGLRRADYSTEDGFEVLEKSGLVEDFGIASSVLCDACMEPHAAKIVYDTDRQSYGWICFDEGFVAADGSDLTAFRVNEASLVKWLSAALDCRQRRSAAIIDGLLWRVGVVDYEHETISAYYASRLSTGDDIKRCAAGIAGESRQRYRILLSPSIESTRGLEIAGTSIASLSELIRSDNHLHLIAEAKKVAELAGVSMPSGLGHPGENLAELDQLIEERQSLGLSITTIAGEDRAIRLAWKGRYPNLKVPSESKVKRRLRKFRSEQ